MIAFVSVTIGASVPRTRRDARGAAADSNSHPACPPPRTTAAMAAPAGRATGGATAEISPTLPGELKL
jgi:hypothetical protein